MQLNITLGDDLPITIPQGASFTRILRCKNEGIRVSLAGYSGRSEVRKKKDLTSDLFITFEIEVSQVDDVDDVDCGKIIWYAGAVETAKLNKNGYYNIELYDPDNLDDVVRIVQGPVTVDLDVTNGTP